MSVFLPLVSELEALFAAALSLPKDAVYSGSRPQGAVRNALEVWLEPLAPRHSPGTTIYRFSVHLVQPAADDTRGIQTAALELFALGQELRAQIDGSRPFADRLPQLVGLGLSGEELGEVDDSLSLSLELDLKAVVHD